MGRPGPLRVDQPILQEGGESLDEQIQFAYKTVLARPASPKEKKIIGSVHDDGKLINVQPIGETPKHFDEEHTDVYGVGAFLLAGSEVYRFLALGRPTDVPTISVSTAAACSGARYARAIPNSSALAVSPRYT